MMQRNSKMMMMMSLNKEEEPYARVSQLMLTSPPNRDERAVVAEFRAYMLIMRKRGAPEVDLNRAVFKRGLPSTLGGKRPSASMRPAARPLLHAYVANGIWLDVTAEALRAMVECGADPNHRDGDGALPLITLLERYHHHGGEEEGPRGLAAAREALRFLASVTRGAGALVLRYAVAEDAHRARHSEGLLLAYVNAVGDIGARDAAPVMHAFLVDAGGHALQNAPRIAQLLLDRCGQDPNERDAEGRTPLHVGVIGRPVLQTLLDAGGDANARDREGRTPYAVRARLFRCPDEIRGLLLAAMATPRLKLLAFLSGFRRGGTLVARLDIDLVRRHIWPWVRAPSRANVEAVRRWRFDHNVARFLEIARERYVAGVCSKLPFFASSSF